MAKVATVGQKETYWCDGAETGGRGLWRRYTDAKVWVLGFEGKHCWEDDKTIATALDWTAGDAK